MCINEGSMIEIIRYRLPVYWACALINDDYTGLSEEEKQEMDAKDLDCLGYVRELRIDDYLSPTTLEEIAEEIKKKVNRG